LQALYSLLVNQLLRLSYKDIINLFTMVHYAFQYFSIAGMINVAFGI